MSQQRTRKPRVAVVGGGLAGLVAAVTAAEEGAAVVLFEGSSSFGGRASTVKENGFRFNLGPHALYKLGAARRFLLERGIDPAGSAPSSVPGLAFDGEKLHRLPAGILSLLRTSLLRWSEKAELAGLLGRLPKLDAEALVGTSQRQWIERLSSSARVRAFLLAVGRLTTYANAPDLLDAGAALRQLQLALAGNVRYLDGGWQRMVDSLVEKCVEEGVEVCSGRRVTGVAGVVGALNVTLESGASRRVEGVIVATTPATAARLIAPQGSAETRRWTSSIPVKATCLDLALSRLPNPRGHFALGIDTPLYLSVHSAVAELAPRGAALVHVARYLAPDEEVGEGVGELEQLMDRVQPGWRELEVSRRVLSRVTVTQALVEVGDSRPLPEESGRVGIRIAGDWVGPEGMLADASFASAERAARGLVERLRVAYAA